MSIWDIAMIGYNMSFIHTYKSYPYLIKSNQNKIVYIIFRLIWNIKWTSVWLQINRKRINTSRNQLIWNQTDVRLVENHWENGKYKLTNWNELIWNQTDVRSAISDVKLASAISNAIFDASIRIYIVAILFLFS